MQRFRRCNTEKDKASGSQTQTRWSPSSQCSDEMLETLCSAGLLTSVVLQQDYGGVHYAGAGVNRAGRCRDAVLIDSGGRDLVLVYAFG